MKSLSLGMKITLGFSILIIIAGLLGIVAVWEMGAVKGQSSVLAREYIPEVDISVELRGAANRLMYEMRGYGFTGEEAFFDRAKMELAAVELALEKARALEKEAIHLKELKEQIDNATQAVHKYKALIAQTHEITLDLIANRKVLDASAAKYMTNGSDFFMGQREKSQRDLVERQKKIDLVEALVNTGAETRVLNFKSQALENEKLMGEAIATIGKVSGLLSQLKKITRDEEDLQRIKAAGSAAKSYRSAMRRYLNEFKKGDWADGDRLVKYRRQMDRNAGIYVKNCDDLFKGQQKKLTRDMLERNEKLALINEVMNIGNASRIGAFKSQALRSPGIMKTALENFTQIENKLVELEKITRLKEDLERIGGVRTAAMSYQSAMGDFLKDWLLLQQLGKQRDEAGRVLIEACKVAANAGMEATSRIANKTVDSLSGASRLVMAGLVVAVAVGIFVALFITRSITGPVGRIISGLNLGSNQVASASGQVSSSSQSTAEGASQQAASIEETSSSMEEMASMTKKNTKNASNADDLMREANQVVTSANGAMEDLTRSMADISQASEETSKIIKTIDEIAFQTNLLALNAAVEAARAGEAGSGFAVVADEVRSLAMRAADAAKDPAGLIEGTVKKVSDGSQLVASTNEAFARVAETSQKVGNLVTEISSASKEQSNGIEQVNNAISEMDRVVQQNAANAEEAASAAEEMSAQAEQLRTYVDDLVILVTGDRNAGGKTMALEDSAPASKLDNRFDSDKKMLGAPPPEVRPEQIIPLEEEDDGDEFKNF